MFWISEPRWVGYYQVGVVCFLYAKQGLVTYYISIHSQGLLTTHPIVPCTA